MTITSSSVVLFGSHKLQYHDHSRILMVDHHLLRFSALQYRMLVVLASGAAISDVLLIRALYGCEANPDVRKNLEKVARKVRSRLQPVGLTVERVARQAYILLAIPE